ncbi:Auxin-induced protein [Macleaya cordata]|uniref:Auxin-induced protein n=1 Tax=Macleaya cordata TaxID=56857 RepID=A0A200R950_MACCD|nr:Auxin-induced protein [Macleaya cordata]OVA19268.1 Auxin-induced protein [Macleaya cordata]
MANKIRKIVQLKQVMKRWKVMSLGRRSDSDSDSDSGSSTGSNRRIPSGFLAVYVGPERRRFVIPTRFLNLPIFVSLLKKAEEEFGYQSDGGLVLPCEVGFFKRVLKVLEKNEQRFRRLELDEFLKMFSEVGFDPCREGKDACHGFTPLLQKTRV